MSDVNVYGLDEMLSKLHKLPDRVQKNVVTGAIRAGASSIAKEMKHKVPVKNGTLKKSIGVVKRRQKDKSIVMFTVAPRVKKGGWYAHFVEFGTKKMSPEPFIRPAYEEKGKDTINIAKQYMSKRLDKELAKL